MPSDREVDDLLLPIDENLESRSYDVNPTFYPPAPDPFDLPDLSTMKIVVMCGGRGTRLGKRTESIPKVLTELHGKPILDHKMNSYLEQGYDDFVLCTGYKSEMVEENAKQYEGKCKVTISNAGEEAGILKRLHTAMQDFEEDAILTYGNTLTDLDLIQLSSYHKEQGTEATIVTAGIQNPFGLVEFDQNNRVTMFREKPVMKYYIGYAVISKSSFQWVSDAITNLPDGAGLVTYFRMLMAMEQLSAWHHEGFQITFNTEKELDQAQKASETFFTLNESHGK